MVLVNLFFVFANGYLAYEYFNEDDQFGGYANLVASAINAAGCAFSL